VILPRRIFNINEPFREIKYKDSTKQFESRLLTACGSTLVSLNLENQNDDHVWVYDANNEILGVIGFTDHGTEFHVEVVSNNFAIPKLVLHETKPGSSLYQTMEDVARMNQVSKITLDSIPDRVDYWKKFGFQSTGNSFDGKFCKLFPMEKKI